MGIKEQLNNDLKTAMKANDTFTRDTIRLLNAALKQVEVDKRIELDDKAVISILLSAKKQRLDSIAAYKKATHVDLLEKEEKELEIIMRYLPRQMSDEELRSALEKIINEIGACGMKDLGKVMGKAKELQAFADGSKISAMAKEILGAK